MCVCVNSAELDVGVCCDWGPRRKDVGIYTRRIYPYYVSVLFIRRKSGGTKSGGTLGSFLSPNGFLGVSSFF